MTEQPLGDLLEVIIDHRGKTPKKLGGTDFTDAGVPVVSAIHIKNGRINWEERLRFAPQWMFEKWMPVRLKKGDVLLTSEAPLGEVAQVETNEPLVLSQRLFALRGKPGLLDSTYLRYFLQSSEGQARLLTRASGTTVFGIRQAELVKILVPVQPFDEQRRIAGVLGAFDDLIDTNRDLADRLRHMRWAAVEDYAREGEPADLGTVASLVRDSVSPDMLAPDMPYLGLEHFAVDGAGVVTTGRAEGLDSHKSRFQAGDVLYGKLRPYFRKVDRPAYSGVCSTEIWVIRGKSQGMQHLVEWAVSSTAFTTHAMSASEGTRMPRANWGHCCQFTVSVPSQEDLRELNEVVQPLYDTEWELRAEAGHLVTVRDELLPLLMSGRVTVDEAWEAVPG